MVTVALLVVLALVCALGATHKVLYKFTSLPDGGGTGLSFSKEVTFTPNTGVDLSLTITTGITNQQHTVSFLFAALKDIAIFSDQDLTLKFNSTGSPVPQIDLVANEPFVWTDASGMANPFTANITDVYITNASGATATFKMYWGYDS